MKSIYSNIECYLTLEAQAYVKELVALGLDKDLAISIVEQHGTESELFDTIEDDDVED